MFAGLICFLDDLKSKNYAYVKEHFGGNGMSGMSQEEIRDYYYALGKADACEELMQEIERLFGNVSRDDILKAAKGKKKNA